MHRVRRPGDNTGQSNFERQVRTMRKLILALAAVAALAVAGPAGAATPRRSTSTARRFSPKSATITEGDTVTWVNRDNSNHQVLADKGQFVSPILQPEADVLVHVPRVRHLHVQGRAASEAHRHDHGQGAAADADVQRLVAVRRLRRQGDAQRRRLEPQGRRVGDDLLPAVSAAEPDPACDRC